MLNNDGCWVCCGFSNGFCPCRCFPADITTEDNKQVGLEYVVIFIINLAFSWIDKSFYQYKHFKWRKNGGKFPRAQGDAFKCLVLSDQQSKPQRYSIYIERKKTHVANPHNWETGTIYCFYLLFNQWQTIFQLSKIVFDRQPHSLGVKMLTINLVWFRRRWFNHTSYNVQQGENW